MFGLSNFAGGASDALTEIIQQKFLEQVQRQRLAQDQERMLQADRMASGRLQQDRDELGERRRQYDTSRADDQAAASAKATDAATKQADAQRRIATFVAANPHLQRIVEAQGVGLQTEDPHKLESPAEHAPHESEARKQKIADISEQEEVRGRVRAKYRAPEKPEKEPAPQIVYGPDGKLRAMQFKGGAFVDVPVPGDVVSKTAPKPAAKTPQQMFEEEKQKAAGRAAGKPQESNWVKDLVGGIYGGKAAPAVKMLAPDGRTLTVPADKVKEMEAAGAKVVGG